MKGKYFRQVPGQSKEWFERDSGARFERDKQLVELHYPALGFAVDPETKRVTLSGNLVLIAGCGVPTEIPVKINFPRDYPTSEPVAYDADNRFTAAPGKIIEDRHICDNGQFCLWLPPNSPWDPSDRNALLRFLDELAVFLDRQLIYDLTTVWPGPQYGHGSAGYIEFITQQLGDNTALFAALRPVFAGESDIGRNDPCPCGKGMKYKKCHESDVKRIEKKVGIAKLRAACRSRGALQVQKHVEDVGRSASHSARLDVAPTGETHA